MIELSVTLGDRFVSREVLSDDVVVIGREPHCDIVLVNPGVSRTHAEIRQVEGRYLVRDLGSKNGIRLNGEPVVSAELDTGDRIGVGKYELTFRRVGADIALASVEDTYPVRGEGRARPRFLASITGDVFHTLECGAGEGIATEHRVLFATEADAEASGRTACPTCR